MQTHAKQVVALIHQLPQADELKFLEKQPSNKKLIAETNTIFIQTINAIRSLVGQTNSTTIPFKLIEETLDQFLENAGIQFDGLNKQNPVLKQPQVQKLTQLKPQNIYNFADSIQLNKLPFIPPIKQKLYAQTELDPRILEAQSNPQKFFEKHDIQEFAHPYHEEISRMLIQDFVANVPQKINKFRDLEPPIMITTQDQLGELILKVQQEVDQQGYSEIAVDLEHNHTISYLGITCLIQLSTRQQDYIIDPFQLWNCLGEMLSVLFHNPRVVKVLHGADSDVQWLQRDFGIYLVNLFDTFHASKELQLPANSYQFLLQEYCKKTTDKTYQTADWTQRPLSDDMIKYAQIDTHYLLYIYDRMRQELKSNTIHLENVIKRSKDTSLKLYRKPLQDQDQSLQLILNKQDRRMDAQSFDLMVKLLELREELGIQHDQNPRYFLPNPTLFRLVEIKPSNIKDLKYYLGGDKNINEIIKENLWQFLKILLEFNNQIQPAEVMQIEQHQQQQQQQQQEDTQQIQQQNIQIEPININLIPISIQKYNNKNIYIVKNEIENENVQDIEQQFNCESSFKLLNIFHNGLGTQIFNSMKEQSQQQKIQVQEIIESKPERINTTEYIKLPNLEIIPKEQEIDVRLNNTLQNQHGTKILKRHKKIEQVRVQKQNISNRFQYE